MIIILPYPIVITCKSPGHVLEILRGVMEPHLGRGRFGTRDGHRDRRAAMAEIDNVLRGATSSGPFLRSQLRSTSLSHRGWRPRPHCRIWSPSRLPTEVCSAAPEGLLTMS